MKSKLIFQKLLIVLTLPVISILAACQPELPPTILECPSDGLPPCTKPFIPKSMQKGCAPKSVRELEPYKTLIPGMSFPEVCAIVGKPDWETGSGLAILIYQLQDGTEVWLGFSGVQGELLYALHMLPDGSNILLSEKALPNQQ